MTRPLEPLLLQSKKQGAQQTTTMRVLHMGMGLTGCVVENFLIQQHNKASYSDGRLFEALMKEADKAAKQYLSAVVRPAFGALRREVDLAPRACSIGRWAAVDEVEHPRRRVAASRQSALRVRVATAKVAAQLVAQHGRPLAVDGRVRGGAIPLAALVDGHLVPADVDKLLLHKVAVRAVAAHQVESHHIGSGQIIEGGRPNGGDVSAHLAVMASALEAQHHAIREAHPRRPLGPEGVRPAVVAHLVAWQSDEALDGKLVGMWRVVGMQPVVQDRSVRVRSNTRTRGHRLIVKLLCRL